MSETNYALLTRQDYDSRQLPPLYFTRDYTVANSILYLKGEEYDHYHWNYDRMMNLLDVGVLSLTKPPKQEQ